MQYCDGLVVDLPIEQEDRGRRNGFNAGSQEDAPRPLASDPQLLQRRALLLHSRKRLLHVRPVECIVVDSHAQFRWQS